MNTREVLTKALRRCRGRLDSRYAAVKRQLDYYNITQWYDRAKLLECQEQKLRDLFAHCWHNVPYYRRVFDQVGARGPEDVSLARLPLLTKPLIRRHFEDLKSRDLNRRKWYTNYSGGSTGEPVTLIQDEEYQVHSEAKKAVCFEWAGYRDGDSMIRLWGSERDILQGGVGWKAILASILSDRLVLNAFRMTPERMRQYLEVINQRRPCCIHAYAHAVFELATFAQKQGIRVSPPGVIVSTSGNLYPFMRETIKKVFGCPLFDNYGCREASCIASECEEHEGLHINMETMVLEILDQHGRRCRSGVEGEIVVTSLVNYAMPIVRYRIGDYGLLSDKGCGCGRGLQLLRQVTGRTMDIFRRADGTIIPGEYFIHFLGVVFNRGWVQKFQVVQEAYDHVEVRIVPDGSGPSREQVQELVRTVRLVMGDTCRVDVHFLDHIPPSESGKYRYTICHLASNSANLSCSDGSEVKLF